MLDFHFDAIALSETFLNLNNDIELFGIDEKLVRDWRRKIDNIKCRSWQEVPVA